MPKQPNNRGGYSGNQPQLQDQYSGKQPKLQDQYSGKQPQLQNQYSGNKPKQPQLQNQYSGNQNKKPEKEEVKEDPKPKDTLQSPSSEIIKSKSSLIDDYEIRNPYVLIIGVSEYTKKNMSKLSGVKVDVPRVYELFKQDFGYKYVFSYLDRLEWVKNGEKEVQEEIKKKKFLKRFLQYHSDQIDYLNDKKDANIDAFIFCYSGHGNLDNILLCEGETYNIETIHSMFNNEEVDTLTGKPKLFIYDCCRGGDEDHEVKVKTGNHRGAPKKKKECVTVNSDMFYWYSTTNDYKAFETVNGKGGFFFNEFVNLYKELIEKNEIYNINQIQKKLRQLVIQASGKKQTPETVDRLTETVSLVPMFLR